MRKPHYKTAYKDESQLFYAATIFFIIVFFAYIYFISVSVAHVVMRKEVDAHISSVGSTISQLEAQYIEVQHLVSNDIATYNGYVVADSKIFIDKSADTLVLSGN